MDENVQPVDGLRVADLRIHEEDIAHVLRGYDIGAAAYADDLALLHQDDLVAISGSEHEVVGNYDDEDLLLVHELPHEVHQIELVVDVEMQGGLVQQHDVGLLNEGSGDHHPSELSAAELVDVPVDEVEHPDPFQGVVDDVHVLIGRVPGSGLGVASHLHSLHHSEREGGAVGLCDGRHVLGQVLARHPLDVHLAQSPGIVYHHASAGGLQDGVDAVEEGGLPTAVLAEDPYDVPALHLERKGFEHALGPVAEFHAFDLYIHTISSRSLFCACGGCT